MIRRANGNDTPQVRELLKTGFGETEAFLDFYFRDIYRPENTVVSYDNERITGSLQTRPAMLYINGAEYPVSYVFYVVTHPDYRNRGTAGEMFGYAAAELQESGVSAMVLIPATESLFKFYGKLGFDTAFYIRKSVYEAKDVPENYYNDGAFYTICHTYKDFKDADIPALYKAYTDLYKKTGFCVLKTPDDFKAYTESFLFSGGVLYTLCNDWVTLGFAYAAVVNEGVRVYELFARDITLRGCFLRQIADRFNTDRVTVTEPPAPDGENTPFAVMRVFDKKAFDIPQNYGYMNMMLND